MRIAVWSGPRNLSTAMMYAFGTRPDCDPVDEPFYAAYLAATGLDHPMRDSVLASQSADPDAVALDLAFEPDGRHRYLKLMTHHMLPDFPRDWMEGARHVFLIRHPARVVASYVAKREKATLADIGFVEQLELFGYTSAFGEPVIVDSDDIRRDPERMLRRLCDAIGLSFSPSMLSWPIGPKPFDGAWAPHWYGAVHRSSGFSGPEGPLPKLEGPAAEYAEMAKAFYDGLHALRLR